MTMSMVATTRARRRLVTLGLSSPRTRATPDASPVGLRAGRSRRAGRMAHWRRRNATPPSGLIRTHCVVVPGAWETSTRRRSVRPSSCSAPQRQHRGVIWLRRTGTCRPGCVRSLALSASGWVPRTVFVATSMTAIASQCRRHRADVRAVGFRIAHGDRERFVAR